MSPLRTLLPTMATAVALSPASAPAFSAEPGAAVSQSVIAEADFGDARLSGREFGLRLDGGPYTLAAGVFGFGADYRYTHYAYEGVASRNRDLHRLRLPLWWSGGEARRLRLEAVPTVAASSNVFKDLFARGSGDDFNLYGSATFEQTPARGWGWRAGVAYDDVFGRRRAYPRLALLHRGARSALALGWPEARFDWQAHPKLRVGIATAPAGGRWHVVSDERGGAEFFYRVEARRAVVDGEWTPAPRWQVRGALGLEFDRRHVFEDDAGARLDRGVADAGFAEVTLRYGF